ncbi:hypothetical protein CEXT_801251 [Caerostris extrusa]|uniref:Uncharacterized protein n=1 Tax=Caerostris extrusa TaxID=172846 RepID=A0AAV4NGC6_CAEEX|nr:hypothetical protein CEXT_801251 [Caerostris extrusa]
MSLYIRWTVCAWMADAMQFLRGNFPRSLRWGKRRAQWTVRDRVAGSVGRKLDFPPVLQGSGSKVIVHCRRSPFLTEGCRQPNPASWEQSREGGNTGSPYSTKTVSNAGESRTEQLALLI